MLKKTIYPAANRNSWDVIVAGGGVGGVAAALAAARTGAKTLLIERNSYVGGVATAGMCCSIFNCYYTSKHELGSKGIPVEIADRLAAAMGYGGKWHEHKGHIIFDLEIGKLVLQEMLEEAGVDIMFQSYVSDVIIGGDTLQGIMVENKSGRLALLAKAVVDATGDADVAALAGVPFIQRQGRDAKHSLCFRLGNVDVDYFIDYFRTNPSEYPEFMDVDWTLEEALKQYDACGTFLYPHGGTTEMAAFKKAYSDGVLPEKIGVHEAVNFSQMHGMKQTGNVHVVSGYTVFDGLDADKISRSMIDGREMAFAIQKVFKKYIPGFTDCYVSGVADNLGVRTARYIDGAFTAMESDLKSGARCADSVGRLVSYEILKRRPMKAWGVQAMCDDLFDLPYRCLLPQKVNGLIMGSGRSVSIDGGWRLRVMVHTMSIGQAAGTAAAIAAKTGTDLSKINIGSVQQALHDLGENIN